VVLGAIALAWVAAIAAEATGAATLLHHDALVGGGGVASVVVFVLAWQVMIAAMMLPTSLPLVRRFEAAAARQPRPRVVMAAFLGGYGVVWSLFGLAAFGLDAGVHAAVDSSTWVSDRAWILAGATVALAGAFQFTGLKDACLDRCRHPAQFLLRFYERGVRGGFRLGARHGVYCVGCCWALMLVLFAAGVASVVWMALLTTLMVHEKTGRLGRATVPVTGTALLGAASVVLAYSAYANAVL
jgi:predicted metal-binding membrane protein